ncbi:MAG: DUF3078 domain-containing protein [Bacteroidaceae bacterium]|nr:DUF3078 domain-containing protein [Bacteroidaceae bacterium]
MRFKALFLVVFASASLQAQQTVADSVISLYRHRMDSLRTEQQKRDLGASRVSNQANFNPYFYRLLLPATYYQSPMQQAFNLGPDLCYSPDYAVAANAATGSALARMYVAAPWLVVRTEEEVMGEQGLRDDVKSPVDNTVKLADKAVPVDLGSEVIEPVEIKARRPKFWKVKGNGSMQFTQSYFSPNWYQGGDPNYAALAMLTLDANYDNKQKLQWDNKLEGQLGFQTSDDELHKFKPTSNLLRATTKLGYKAAKNWYYSAQVQAYTQLVRQYKKNSEEFVSDFLSPLNMNVAVGMDYKFNSKKNKFNGSLFLAPIAYNMRYIRNEELRKADSNIKEGKYAYHNFGPSILLRYHWDIVKNVSWDSRLFFFTSLHYVNVEWENTINFTINKYLSSKVFIYPRFDDSNKRYAYDDNERRKHGYLMFKELLSLGLSYNF